MMGRGGQPQGNRSGRKGAGTNTNKKTVRAGGNDHDDSSSDAGSTRGGGGRSSEKYSKSVILGGDEKLFECIDQLTEQGASKRSKRERSLDYISDCLSGHVCTEVESHSEALQTNLIAILRKGGKMSEIQSAHDVLRALVITTGWGDQSMFDKCRLTLERAAKHGTSPESSAAAVLTLSLLCFVCSCDEVDTKMCMQLLDDMGCIADPQLLISHSNDSDFESDSESYVLINGDFVSSTSESEKEGDKQRHDPLVQEAALLAWGLLSSTVSDEYIGDEVFDRYASRFLHLLSSNSNTLRMEAGENLAILFEAREAAGAVSGNTKTDELIDQIYENLEELSVEGGAASNKKEAKLQRMAFRQIVSSVVHGMPPELKVEAELESLEFNTWAQIRQIRVLRNVLGGGLMRHLHDNESLRMGLDLGECPGDIATEYLNPVEKRLFLSPNSADSKDWTNNRNRDRMAKGVH